MSNFELNLEKRKDGGAPVFLASIENTGETHIKFTTSTSRVFEFNVCTTDGEQLNVSGPMSTHAVQTVSIEPGEVKEYSMKWNKGEGIEESLDIDRDKMWEDYPEDFDEVIVSAELCTEIDGTVPEVEEKFFIDCE